eukprot:scaffold11781_cov96-Isochrysis_galbana.AAC.3
MRASRLRARAAALAALWCQARAVHTTIAAPCSYELVVKKSRFVALAAPVQSGDEAAAWIRAASDDQARHNCFAYRLADGSVRTNGDGEPSGTAGPPIAAAIAGAGLWDVAVLVRRYRLDGGAKLGTGGLVRAYGGAAAAVLGCAQQLQVVPHTPFSVSFDPADTGTVYRILGRYECTAPAAPVGPEGSERMRGRFAIPEGEADEVRRGLAEATQGRVRMGGSEAPTGADSAAGFGEEASDCLIVEQPAATPPPPPLPVSSPSPDLDAVEGLGALLEGFPLNQRQAALIWCRQIEAGSVALLILAGIEEDFIAALQPLRPSEQGELRGRLRAVAREVLGEDSEGEGGDRGDGKGR